jgi:hypothetical protein
MARLSVVESAGGEWWRPRTARTFGAVACETLFAIDHAARVHVGLRIAEILEDGIWIARVDEKRHGLIGSRQHESNELLELESRDAAAQVKKDDLDSPTSLRHREHDRGHRRRQHCGPYPELPHRRSGVFSPLVPGCALRA